MATETKDSLRCSFCGKQQREVAKLIHGPNVHICNECVGVCNEIIADELGAEKGDLQESAQAAQPERKIAHVGEIKCPTCLTTFDLHSEVFK